MKKNLSTLLSFLVTLIIPIFLLMLGVRILLTPAFPEVEYRMPGFPDDAYGFTQEQRLKYAKNAIDYLNNNDVLIFGDPNYEDTFPLYNQRETNHMKDVKNLVQFGLRLWVWATGLLAALGVWAKFGQWRQAYLLGAKRGGWLTLILTGLLGILASINFWTFFEQFHHLFFTGDSWIFYYSDTLIRLFPMRLWQDAFLMEGIIVVGGGLALAFGLKAKN